MKYDLIVIGGGPGGYVAAIKAAKSGLKTALIEKDRLGGTCLNRGCIPAKAMIHASEVYREALEADRFGVSADGVAFDYGRILEYKQETIDGLVGGVEQLLKANSVEVINGMGRLLMPEGGSNRVEVDALGADHAVSDSNDSTVLEAESVILAAGSKPASIPIPGIDLPGVLNSDGLFALDKTPDSLVIIGGGVIGVEFATVFANLGCRVTIVEALPKILDNFDKEVSQNLKMILKKRGVEMHTGAMVKEIVADGEGTDDSGACKLTCRFTEKDKDQSVTAQYILCAAGRVPVLEDLFAGGMTDGGSPAIVMNGKFIKVDENYMTSMPGVYAIGDITGGIQLAHAASAHGIRAVEHIIHNGGASEDYSQNTDVIPGCVYTDPEIAQVGMTEAEAKEEGREVLVGKFIMSANGKSLVTREERGFIKVIADASTEKILGAQMMCARATDMIGEFTTAIVSEMTVSDMLRGVRAHPTYSEGIGEALEDTIGESIHTVPRRR